MAALFNKVWRKSINGAYAQAWDVVLHCRSSDYALRANHGDKFAHLSPAVSSNGRGEIHRGELRWGKSFPARRSYSSEPIGW